MRLGTDTKHSAVQNFTLRFKTCSHNPTRRLQVRFSKAPLRTPTQRLNRMRFQKQCAIVSAICSFVILRDHGSHRDVQITPALFQSLRLIVDHFSNPSRFPPSHYQTHQDATYHNTNQHPSCCYPAICSVSIDPRSWHGSRIHSDFACRCSLYQCHRRQGS